MSTGPNQILLKRSDTATSVPSGLSFGEPAINTANGKLFFQEQIDGTVTGRMLSFHGFTNESFVTNVNGSTGSVNAVTSVGVSGGTVCTNAKAVAFTSNTTGLTFETSCHGNTAHVILNAEALRSFVPEALYNYSTISGSLTAPAATEDGDFVFNPDNNKVAIYKRTVNGIDYRDFLFNVASTGIGSIEFYSVQNAQQDKNEIFFDEVVYNGTQFTFTAYQTFPDGVTGASGDIVSVKFKPAQNILAASRHFETPDGSTFGTVVTSFNGETGAVEGVGSFNGVTGDITTSGLHLHVAGLSVDVGITFSDGTTMSTAFTTQLKSKLDAIEASADVTDATNVTSAGALMDSELASIADVKALDQSVVSGASPTFGTANFTDASNKRLMTDAQESKLDGITQVDTLGVVVDGAGSIVTAGPKGHRFIPYACTITNVVLVGDTTGTADFHVYRDSNFNLSGTTLGGISLGGGQTLASTTGFTTGLVENDMLEFKITGSPEKITRLSLFIEVEKT